MNLRALIRRVTGATAQATQLLWDGIDKRDPEKVSVAIEKGALVGSRNKHGSTPLHVAASISSPEIVQQLCAAGADANATEAAGNTPLHDAVSRGLKSGSDREEEEKLTANIVMVVGCLLAAKANPNLASESRTPLWFAINNPRYLVVKTLIEGGADPNYRFGDSHTPLSFAKTQTGSRWDKGEEQVEQIISLLENYGCSNVRFANLEEQVAYALAFVGKHDEMSKRTDEAIYVIKRCDSCFHYCYPTPEHVQFKIQSDRDTPCSSYRIARGLRKERVPIVIPKDLAGGMYCDAWKEAELTHLLVQGFEPHRISYYRRHPKMPSPDFAGVEETFSKFLAERYGL